uniref:Phosphoglycerate kinase n=2 Tax=Hemiselmis andersenii TaxID=464988 RepID=A0A6U4N8M0_HEMAN|mmetsp:Transcript_41095/g.95340  ORF Transcript_41095/g.95340 Transcript_41095/m.95340 type:complete len:490 (+) Transcript_41095:43-1512(+)
MRTTVIALGLVAAADAFVTSPAFFGGNTAIAASKSSAANAFAPSLRTTAPAQGRLSLREGRASGIKMMAAAKKSVGDLGKAELEGKKVLIRCDLNVPLDGKKITDDTRIRASIPTIKHLLDNGARVAVSSHLGRPKGPEDKFSLGPCADRLTELLGQDVKITKDCIGDETKAAVDALKDGECLLLENVRFYPEEEKNDSAFAKKLAAPFDMYVNDAFGTAHRAHASTAGATEFLKPSVAGFLLQKELDYLDGAVSSPKRPFAAIVGGSKVSSKIGVIDSLMEKCDVLVIGGGMVFTFLKARGLEVGSSLVEEDKLDLAKSLEAKAKEKGIKLILPSDVVLADKFDANANTKVSKVEDIEDGWMGLDNGPEATKEIQAELAKCKTIIWNGPMGVFEMDKFAAGTNDVAKTLAECTGKGAITIIGGGDSVAAVEKAGLADKMSHISTGGGASLELLEGKVLPGVAALDSKEEQGLGDLGAQLKGFFEKFTK